MQTRSRVGFVQQALVQAMSWCTSEWCSMDPGGTVAASTRTEEAEGAPSTGGNPQMTRQHPWESTGTKKVQI
ncbi:hypothetical protein NDU88_003790, partial [Pleurodeles waltl]